MWQAGMPLPATAAAIAVLVAAPIYELLQSPCTTANANLERECAFLPSLQTQVKLPESNASLPACS